MKPANFFELVCQALPNDLNPDELRSFAPSGLFEKNNRAATAYIIRHCSAIDWEAYLENNPDVKEACIDPVLHFMQNGVFEGRKLYSKPSFYLKNTDNILNPLISIVVANYNNEIYLDDCLTSLSHQTLENIEIIVVDDASTDNSVEKIKNYLKKDDRMRLVILSRNSSLHMVRKEGVKRASGRYIMFLDSDDYYKLDACEKAYSAISKGYDIVQFNGIPICDPMLPREDEQKVWRYLHTSPLETNEPLHVLNRIYRQGDIPVAVWCKIYAGSLCRHVFGQMEKGYFPRAQDLYETLALVSSAKNYCIIANELICYRVSSGISNIDSSDYVVSRYATVGKLLMPIKNWLEHSNLLPYMEPIKRILMRNSLAPLWNNMPPENITNYINNIIDQYGIIALENYLVDNYLNNWKQVAQVFKYYNIEYLPSRKFSTIGIMYNELWNGGIESVLFALCNLLIKNNYNVVLFLHKRNKNDNRINKNVKIIYLDKYSYDAPTIKQHIFNLYGILKTVKIDLMMFHRNHRESVLWESILLHYFDIPVFMFEHGAYYIRLLSRSPYLTSGAYEQVLQCMDKVVVLSLDAEVYYHACGVNAQYIPNPVQVPANVPLNDGGRGPGLVFVARFSDRVKQSAHVLFAFAEIVKEFPKAELFLVGEFDFSKDRDVFLQKASELGVRDRITETGWVPDPSCFLDRAAILIMTSFTECFPLALCEAQARGLPAIIYDIPIMPVLDNESVIVTPQGQYKAMAEEAVKLLKDPLRLRRLSAIARQKASRFSSVHYINEVKALFDSFTRQSRFQPTPAYVYERVMKTMAYYSTTQAPV